MQWLNRLRANFGGYFTLPCPSCGQEFYGFQHERCGSMPHPDPDRRKQGISKMICPDCTSKQRSE